MKNENQEKKNFITKIREMTVKEKVALGIESYCYLATAGALTTMGFAIAGREYGMLFLLGMHTGTFALCSQAVRLSRSVIKQSETRKNLEKMPKEEDSQKCLKKILQLL